MEKVFPELVNTNDEGYKAVSYDKLTVVLLEAVKEQQEHIEELNTENTKMRKQFEKQDEIIADLRNRIEALED